jgi:hypothetical protein
VDVKSLLGKVEAKFALTRPDELRALRNFRTPEADQPGSILLPFLERFPMFPEWPAYPAALKENALLHETRKLLDRLKQTDPAFHELHLQLSREQDGEHRVIVRRGVEDDAVFRHAEAIVSTELLRRARHFRKAKVIADRMTDLLQRTRLYQLACYEYVRERSHRMAELWKDERVRAAVRAFAERKTRWDLRVEDLYKPSDLGGSVKTPGSGRPLEYVLGQLYNEVCRQITIGFGDWHKADGRIARDNGAVVRAGPNGGGDTPEVVMAALTLPEIKARTAEFDDWRATAFLIMTANDGFQHAFRQGHLPEAAHAARALPIVDARVDANWRYWDAQRWASNDGGAIVRMPTIGDSSPAVHAAVHEPVKDEATRKLAEARGRNRYVVTSNGAIGQLAEVGKLHNTSVDDVERPKRAEDSAAFTEWHTSHLFGRTPNGGWAPLNDVGASLEGLTAERHANVAEVRTDGFESRAAHNLWVPTANGGYAPLPEIGERRDTVAAEVRDVSRDAMTDFLLDRRLEHRFVPTANDGWARLPSIGRALEQVVSDLKATKKDAADPRPETTTSRPETTPTSDGATPLPSGGRVLAEAKIEQAELRAAEAPAKRGLDAFRKNVAAHAARLETSRFNDHAVTSELAAREPRPAAADESGSTTSPSAAQAAGTAADHLEPAPVSSPVKRSA